MITAEGQRNRTVTLQISETWPTGCVRCVQQPVLEGSGSINIGHLLRQLLPIDAGIGETGQPTSEAETVGDRVSGNVA